MRNLLETRWMQSIFSILALISCSGLLLAHVRLVSPNGGETLRKGTSYRISWSVIVSHGPNNFDLYYSTTGSSGPWLPLAMDLPGNSSSYDWRVPVDARSSKTLRVRIVQDNAGQDYDDISNADLSLAPSMSAKSSAISVSKGGLQVLQLDAGKAQAGDFYLILGSLSGTKPGLRIGSHRLALNPDAYLTLTASLSRVPWLLAAIGRLDAQGKGLAGVKLAAGFVPRVLIGRSLQHAFVAFSPRSLGIRMFSNAVELQLKS